MGFFTADGALMILTSGNFGFYFTINGFSLFRTTIKILGPHNPLFQGYHALFSQRLTQSDHACGFSLLSIDEIKTVWSYTSILS
jgi:hypothetical protein